MPRNQQKAKEENAFQRVAGVVKRLFGRNRSSEQLEASPAPSAAAPQQARPKAKAGNTTAQTRPTKRETDIPLDIIGSTYTPPATSSKSGFRDDGADHQRDQEFSRGADDRWNDEDHLTNKSGDPRIGTHRRTYEPGETRAESRE